MVSIKTDSLRHGVRLTVFVFVFFCLFVYQVLIGYSRKNHSKPHICLLFSTSFLNVVKTCCVFTEDSLACTIHKFKKFWDAFAYSVTSLTCLVGSIVGVSEYQTC